MHFMHFLNAQTWLSLIFFSECDFQTLKERKIQQWLCGQIKAGWRSLVHLNWTYLKSWNISPSPMIPQSSFDCRLATFIRISGYFIHLAVKTSATWFDWAGEQKKRKKKRIKKNLKSLLTEALFCLSVQRSEKDFSSLRWSELAQQLRSRNDAFTDAPEDQRNYLLSSFCGWTTLIYLSAWVHKCWCDVDSVQTPSLQGGYRLLLQNQNSSFLYSFGIPSLTGHSKSCSTPGIFYFRLV